MREDLVIENIKNSFSSGFHFAFTSLCYGYAQTSVI